MVDGSISPRELVEYWVEHPTDLPLSAIIRLCGQNDYAIPSGQLAELEAIDARRNAKAGKGIALVEPDIPVGYRVGATVNDPSVIEQGLSGGILADDGASGVLVVGGDDACRGAAAASLLLAMQTRFRTNDVNYVDWENMIDKCRAAPLFGPESVDAALNPLKDVSILVLHGVDSYAGSRDGAEALEKVLRSRSANGGKTIMTSSVAWPVLERSVGKSSNLREYLASCIRESNSMLNVIEL